MALRRPDSTPASGDFYSGVFEDFSFGIDSEPMPTSGLLLDTDMLGEDFETVHLAIYPKVEFGKLFPRWIHHQPNPISILTFATATRSPP